ncbi:MAG TPA: M20/M25/M40 family metallo-hydrolase [Solirubrobacteraceae bacterium]|jgi:glutamate carboxypeptidase|nr:M20/M25/M40 family metallo-hydrolase [Solirubrobacteraceae bacterium]
MPNSTVDEAAEIAERAEAELEALVGVSSPSGDVAGAEEALALCLDLLPEGGVSERVPCSTPGCAPDLVARYAGTGTRRVLLLGHVDTVFAHEDHAPLRREGERLHGSGTADMKGGVVLSLGVARALAVRPEAFAELAVLLVTDEEWRTDPFTHVERFAGYDACLCFEAGERGPGGEEAVVVRRKAAATVRVRAHGLAAHSGSAPDKGRNALLALTAAAETVAAHHDPGGPERMSAVPTVLHAGAAFNVVPAEGELLCDLRADRLEAVDAVVAKIPEEVGGATLEAVTLRRWPGMDTSEAARPLLARAGDRLGRPIIGVPRGGASDASHFATAIPLTFDGLGPRGGGAHTPGEFVLAASLRERAEVALAMAAEVLS